MTALERVFDATTLGRWRIALGRGASEELSFRLQVLTACGPATYESEMRVARLRARRAAWEAYVEAAETIGLLDDSELLNSLRAPDYDAFRGALAECCVAWFLSGRLALAVSGKPPGRAARGAKGPRKLDLRTEIAGEEVRLDVKAPFVPRLNRCWSGDDAAAVSKCVKSAAEQFERGCINVVAIVPKLRTMIADDRLQLVNALIGEHAITVHVSLDPKAPRRPSEPTFLPIGQLAKLWRGEGGTFTPQFTRVSAVVSIEEEPNTREFENGTIESFIEHTVRVVHNPFADKRLPRSMFHEFPQLVVSDSGDEMAWTDGFTGFGR